MLQLLYYSGFKMRDIRNFHLDEKRFLHFHTHTNTVDTKSQRKKYITLWDFDLPISQRPILSYFPPSSLFLSIYPFLSLVLILQVLVPNLLFHLGPNTYTHHYHTTTTTTYSHLHGVHLCDTKKGCITSHHTNSSKRYPPEHNTRFFLHIVPRERKFERLTWDMGDLGVAWDGFHGVVCFVSVSFTFFWGLGGVGDVFGLFSRCLN